MTSLQRVIFVCFCSFMLFTARPTFANVPLLLNQQGRVLDSSGKPMSGVSQLTFRFYEQATGGTAHWTESLSASFQNGYYSVNIGTSKAFTLDVLNKKEVWVGVTVGSGGPELTPRLRMTSVPFSIMAHTALNVKGGEIDVTTIKVGGTTVIDSSGKWVGSSTGLKGDKGEQGVAGPKGDKGEQGAQGAQGIKGDKGDKGEQGVAGPKGDKGDPATGGNIILQLELNETTGTTFADTSGYANQVTAPVAGVTVGVSGYISNAVQFKGGYLKIASTTKFPPSPHIWIEAWVNPTTFNSTQILFSKPNAFTLKLLSSKILNFEVFTQNTVTGSRTCNVRTDADLVTLGSWQHISAWYNGMYAIIAINGATVARKKCSGAPLVTTPDAFYIGGAASGTTTTEPFTGIIDELRIRRMAPYVAPSGALYTHWGRASCRTSTAARLLSSGYIFFGYHTESGSGQQLCLAGTVGPEISDFQADTAYPAKVSTGPWNHTSIRNNQTIPCSVCLSPTRRCFELQGRHTCPAGYQVQYTGYLYGSSRQGTKAAGRVCIDKSPSTGKPSSSLSGNLYPTIVFKDYGTNVTNTGNGGYPHVECVVCCGG